MRDEAFCGEVRALHVAAREALAADVQLAGNADGDRAQRGVEDVQLQIGQGLADDAAAAHVACAERAVGDMHRGLGDAIHVHELRLRIAVSREPRLEAAHFQSLAAEDDEPES